MKAQSIKLAFAVVLIIGSIFFLQSRKTSVDVSAIAEDAEIILPGLSASEKEEKYERAREFVEPAGFINSVPFELKDVIGKKVILLDIWTYSCINCQRTLPYIVEWNKKYEDEGLLVVGVHSPEFEFEKKLSNVQDAVNRFSIEYPVVLDNDMGTWHAYRNRYWPRKYLIDIDGFIVYDHIGEGGYEETENKIKELLAERAEKLGVEVDLAKGISNIVVEDAVTDFGSRSPEVYFGAWRNSTFGNGTPLTKGSLNLDRPTEITPDQFYLVGAWDVEQEFSRNAGGDARLIYHYRGDKVFMVASAENGADLEILQDGEPVGSAAGADVDARGKVRVQEDRLYKLIDNPDGTGEHTLEIIIKDPGLQIFTFTFS